MREITLAEDADQDDILANLHHYKVVDQWRNRDGSTTFLLAFRG